MATQAVPDMIMVMGVTGSGKSYFINKLRKDAVLEGSGLNSETRECQVVRLKIGDTYIAVVDTPGFDDTKRSDTEILDQITQFLVTQYLLGISLKGIIYFHRITDNKMQGSALRYFRMFQSLCGDHALGNVVLVTTMWNQLKDRALGLRRDQQLRDEFWSLMEDKGSCITSFDGSAEMAETIVYMLLDKPSIVLDIQREVVDEGRRLGKTSAGRLIMPPVEFSQQTIEMKSVYPSRRAREESDERREHKNPRESERLDAKLYDEVASKIVAAQKKNNKKRDLISIFGTILSLGITLTTNVILPLCGVAF